MTSSFLNPFFRQQAPKSLESSNRRLLTVEFVECKDLISIERSGRSEPVIKAFLVSNDVRSGKKIDGEEYTTKKPVGNNNSSPQYNESFIFGKVFDLNCETLPSLFVTVFHKTAGEKLGMLEIPLDTLSGVTDRWYPLQRTSGMSRVSGEVHLRIRFAETVGTDLEAGGKGFNDRVPNSRRR